MRCPCFSRRTTTTPHRSTKGVLIRLLLGVLTGLTAPSHSTSFILPSSRSYLHHRHHTAIHQLYGKKGEKDTETKKGIGRFVPRFFKDEDQETKEKETTKSKKINDGGGGGGGGEDDEKNGEGIFRKVTKRVPEMSGENKKLREQLESETVTSQNKTMVNFNPVQIVGDVVDSIGGKVVDFRRGVSSVRTEDNLNTGLFLKPEEEARRLDQIRKQIQEQRIKKQEEERKESEAKAKAREEAATEARAKKAQALQKQKDLPETTDVVAANDRKRLNPQSMPQKALGSIRKIRSSEPNDNKESVKKEDDGFNPIASARRLASGVWESTPFSGKNKETDEEEWRVVFPVTRLDPGEVVPVSIGGINLLVAASVDGKKLYCIANSCPHLGTPLETGMMERRPVEGSGPRDTPDGCEDCIVCPLHQTAFALESGEVRGEWCPYPPVLGKVVGAVNTKSSVAIFETRTRGKNVEVRINSSIRDL